MFSKKENSTPINAYMFFSDCSISHVRRTEVVPNKRPKKIFTETGFTIFSVDEF